MRLCSAAITLCSQGALSSPEEQDRTRAATINAHTLIYKSAEGALPHRLLASGDESNHRNELHSEMEDKETL